MPRAKKRQKKLPEILSAVVYPLSLAILQRPSAAVCERYLSSRSPPDHLLYQMLNIVPVCGGGSDFTCDASTCARAGRLFLRMIFLTFRSAGGATSLLVVVRAVDVDVDGSSGSFWEAGIDCGVAVSTSAILDMCVGRYCTTCNR